jgi:hypothetical protein
MSELSQFQQSIHQVFRPNPRAVLGLVDDLLELCPEQGLELDGHGDQCRVRSIGAEPQEIIDIPVPKSVLRAVLARLAALCNERNPGSVSPYGGEGELTVGVDPATVCRVNFTNTQDVQRAQLTRIQKVDYVGDTRQPQHPALDSDPLLRTPAAR